jgi:hypothetical protein
MPDDTMAVAIRKKCIDCSGGSRKEVRLCPVVACPLWPYRFGKRPETKAKTHPELIDPEQVKRLIEEDVDNCRN